jgi:uncharacterized protein
MQRSNTIDMDTKENQIIQQTVAFVKDELSNAEGGHDWWHIYRVWKMALRLAEEEKANLFVVSLGALLHDIADAKFYGGDEEIGPRKAEAFLQSIDVEKAVIDQVLEIIRHVSFKNRDELPEVLSIELQIVQDADRLDAIGAMGIARAFSFGGFKGRAMYDPAIKANPNQSKAAYKAAKSPTINHFYEKLLLLKDMMNTDAGKQMAAQRHRFMEQYLEQFYAEWEGKR